MCLNAVGSTPIFGTMYIAYFPDHWPSQTFDIIIFHVHDQEIGMIANLSILTHQNCLSNFKSH